LLVDRLARLLAQFKSDGPPGFLLPDRCAIRRVSASGDIFDPDGDDITATKLTVDCQIEHGQGAGEGYRRLALTEARPEKARLLHLIADELDRGVLVTAD
jgi:hypothetical protein